MTFDILADAQSNIRRQILARRKALSQNEVTERSEEAVDFFLDCFAKSAKTGKSALGTPTSSTRSLNVGMYSALPFELSLKSLEFKARDLTWNLHYPRIIDYSNKLLEFVKVPDPVRQQVNWKVGHYGIEEPQTALAAISPECLDLIFVPGVVFGQEGQRIGMGGGFYDRFLPRASQALLIALSFDFQVLAEVVQQEWDQPVHWVITEKQEYRTPFIQQWWDHRGDCRP